MPKFGKLSNILNRSEDETPSLREVAEAQVTGVNPATTSIEDQLTPSEYDRPMPTLAELAKQYRDQSQQAAVDFNKNVSGAGDQLIERALNMGGKRAYGPQLPEEPTEQEKMLLQGSLGAGMTAGSLGSGNAGRKYLQNRAANIEKEMTRLDNPAANPHVLSSGEEIMINRTPEKLKELEAFRQRPDFQAAAPQTKQEITRQINDYRDEMKRIQAMALKKLGK